jgi:hypothetical protein
MEEIETLEINPRGYSQVIFNKATKNMYYRKCSLFDKWFWEKWIFSYRRMKLDTPPPATKTNLNWILNLNLKCETTKLLEENIDEML